MIAILTMAILALPLAFLSDSPIADWKLLALALLASIPASDAALALDPKSQPEPASHPLDAQELHRCAGVYLNGTSKIGLEAEGSALKASIDGTVSRFTRAGDKFLLGDLNGTGEPSKIVLVPDSKGRIEFVFINGRAFRRAD